MTIDQFGKALVASGLMTADDVKATWSAIPPESRPKDGAAFGKLLVDKALLTPFQAAELLAGRGARLIMGDYTIVTQIGAGGMGQVYKAQHRRMKRTVALKVMSNAAMQDEAAVKRFQREVHAAARLEHPNIVTAYDSGEAGSVKYLVMQFVDGGDLSDLVKKNGRLGIEQAVGYVIQAAKGLAFAHGEGVIHRDIKPANLLLDKKGIVKILDMGLARFEDGGDGLTATEQVMGTVDYMSPEQAANTKGCDGRADIYSLGCTLWYLLTGKKLYEADTLIARLMLHRDGPLPSLVKERDDAPWPLEQALHKMIAKRAADRYQSMDEVVAALAPYGGDPSLSGSLGSSGTGGGQSAELASFMQSMGTGGTKTSHPSATQMKGAPVTTGNSAKPATSANLEATAQLSTADVGTDPKSQLLPPAKNAAQPQAKGSGKKPPPYKNLLLAGAGGGALLLLLGVWFIFRDKDGNEVARVQLPEGGSVSVQQPAAAAARPTPIAIPTASAVSLPASNTPGSMFGLSTSDKLPPAEIVTPAADGFVYLDDLKAFGWTGRPAQLQLHGLGYNGEPFKWNGAQPSHSLFTHAVDFGTSRLRYPLDARYENFAAEIGGLSNITATPLTFRVVGDGRELWKSRPIKNKNDTDSFSVSVRGVGELHLEVDCPGSSQHGHAVWIAPRLTPGRSAAPGNAPPQTIAPAVAAPRWPLAPSKPEDIRWLLDELKAIVALRVGPGPEVRRKSTDPLPTGPATIVGIEAHRDGGPQMTDAALARIATLTDLEMLRCDFGPPGAAATKAGLAEIAKLTELRHLQLSRMGTADTDYSFLERLPHLKRLGLAYVPIPDWGAQVRRLAPVRELTLHYMDLARLTDLKFCRGLELVSLSGDTEKNRQAIRAQAPLSPWIRFELRISGVATPEVTMPTTPLPPAPPPGAPAVMQNGPPPAVFPFDAATAVKHQEAWAKYLGVPVEKTIDLPGGVKMIVVLIPPGEFLMGSTTGEQQLFLDQARAASDQSAIQRIPTEGPQHRVRITRPFYLGKHEVTQAQWLALMGQNPSKQASSPTHPVEQVSWDDVQAFLTKLNAGRVDVAMKFGLPTEAQWEFACRAGTTTHFSCGDDPLLLDQYAWTIQNSGLKSNPVGTRLPNGFGLCDMHGNVWEWCADRFAPDYYAKSPVDDPTGPSTGTARVTRGGSWTGRTGHCHSAHHGNNQPNSRSGYLGFRVTATIEDVDDKRSDTTPLAASRPNLAVFPFDAATALRHQEAWAEYLGVPVEFTNGVGMKFRLIPPGEFQMGLGPEFTDEELLRLNSGKDDLKLRGLHMARPAHLVGITRPFYMEVEEVTVGRYRDVVGQLRAEMEQNPNAVLAHWVAWPDAIAFCNRLSEREGKRPAYRIEGAQITPIDDADGYRLPTEAQWEYACRAGTNTLWHFGSDGGADFNEFRKRCAVPNPFGLTGLYGGANEWCWDATNGNPYRAVSMGRRDDPREDVGTSRIKRGGSGNDDSGGNRGAINSFVRIRSFGGPFGPDTSRYTGFGRVVLPIAAPRSQLAATKTDLLKNLDVVVNAVAGKFALDGQGLRVTDGAQQARVVLPVDPIPAEYDLYIAVGRSAPGGKAFVVGVPWQGSQGCVVVDGFSNPPLSGLELVDGQTPKVNGTENPGEKITFGPRNHKLIVRVRIEGIAAECDGKPLFDWKGKPSQLSTHAMWAVPRKDLPFLGFQGPYVVHSVELLPFVAKPVVPAASTAKLFMHDPAFPQWMKDVQAMPAAQQIEAVSKKLMELNPGFDGKATDLVGSAPPKIEGGAVVEWNVITDHVTDLSPIRALSDLKVLSCGGTLQRAGRVFDLSPLQGMKLSRLHCSYSQISDLTPIKGLPLIYLRIGATRVSDLSPLKDLLLTDLFCFKCGDLRDISILESISTLKTVGLKETSVSAASVAALQAKLPNCKIEWNDPAKAMPQPAVSGTK